MTDAEAFAESDQLRTEVRRLQAEVDRLHAENQALAGRVAAQGQVRAQVAKIESMEAAAAGAIQPPPLAPAAGAAHPQLPPAPVSAPALPSVSLARQPSAPQASPILLTTSRPPGWPGAHEPRAPQALVLGNEPSEVVVSTPDASASFQHGLPPAAAAQPSASPEPSATNLVAASRETGTEPSSESLGPELSSGDVNYRPPPPRPQQQPGAPEPPLALPRQASFLQAPSVASSPRLPAPAAPAAAVPAAAPAGPLPGSRGMVVDIRRALQESQAQPVRHWPGPSVRASSEQLPAAGVEARYRQMVEHAEGPVSLSGSERAQWMAEHPFAAVGHPGVVTRFLQHDFDREIEASCWPSLGVRSSQDFVADPRPFSNRRRRTLWTRFSVTLRGCSPRRCRGWGLTLSSRS